MNTFHNVLPSANAIPSRDNVAKAGKRGRRERLRCRDVNVSQYRRNQWPDAPYSRPTAVCQVPTTRIVSRRDGNPPGQAQDPVFGGRWPPPNARANPRGGNQPQRAGPSPEVPKPPASRKLPRDKTS